MRGLLRKGKNLSCVQSMVELLCAKQTTLRVAYFFILQALAGLNQKRKDARMYTCLQLIITDVIRRMEVEVTCPRCQKEYSDENCPRLLTGCGHTFCQKCLTDLCEPHQEGKSSLACPECPNGASSLFLERIEHLPKNLALLNFLQIRKNNTSTRSINSLKDESFNVPRINRSYQEEDEDVALITAINGKEGEVQRKKQRGLTTPVLSQRVSEGEERCLLHDKQVELVCLVDWQRLCSKCALFGQHRGHEFVSLDQVEQGNRKIYEMLLSIFDQKATVLDQLTSKKRRQDLSSSLAQKTTALKKEVSDRFKKIQDEMAKAERAIAHKLDDLADTVERKMKKLLVLDDKTIEQYESWAVAAEKKFNCYQSGTHEGLLEFYLGGKALIDSGKDIITQLRRQEGQSNEQAQKYIEELGVVFNDGPCLASIAKVAQPYQSDKDFQRKMTQIICEKENSKLFANCEFSCEDIKQRVKTEAHEDDESLLELVDQFEQNRSVHSKILDQSIIKPDKSTPTRLPRPSTNGTPTSKPVHRKKPTVIAHKELSKEEKKEEKKDSIPREAIKKKMRSIKIHEKYEKMLEGVMTDTVETVDFTNAEMGDAIALQVCEMLKGCTRPKNLKLIRNKITDDGFAKMIPLFGGLSLINLSQNLLTENCLNVLSDHRSLLPNLKTVILSQNKIAQRKCKGVVEKLRKMDLAISI